MVAQHVNARSLAPVTTVLQVTHAQLLEMLHVKWLVEHDYANQFLFVSFYSLFHRRINDNFIDI